VIDPTLAVDLITRFIANLGFPIFVAVWLLIRTDRLLRSLTSAINQLADAIGQPHNGVDDKSKITREV
jgi:hypothetical protein